MAAIILLELIPYQKKKNVHRRIISIEGLVFRKKKKGVGSCFLNEETEEKVIEKRLEKGEKKMNTKRRRRPSF